MIVNVFPAAVIVPVRELALAFAATLKATDAEPVAAAPDVIVIQASAVDAVQPQPAGVVTANVPVPPPDANGCDAGEIV